MRKTRLLKHFLLLCALIAGSMSVWADNIATATFNGKDGVYTTGWTTTGTGKTRTDCIVIGHGENITSPAFDLSGYSNVTISIKARRMGTLSGSKATIDASIAGTSVGTVDATSTTATTPLNDITFTPTSTMNAAVLVFTCTNATGAGSTHGAGINTITLTGTKAGETITYTVTYDANGATSGTAPTDNTAYEENAEVTVLDNTGNLEKTNFSFDGWNTKADGTGTNRAVGSKFNISANTTLYAKWTPVSSGVDYATLPFSWAGGPKADLVAIDGVTGYGLGSDYSSENAPYLVKLDGTGDYILIKTDSQPGKVTIGVKMLGGATASKITVQGSSDGTTYTNVEELTISGNKNDILNLETTNAFAADVRYVKLLFTKGSNVGVGPISIAKPSTDPEITAGNVEIAYDATEGAISYTINNPVEGGVLTAAVPDGSWVTLGTVGETVPFTCSANTVATARTATVTLTYTYNTDETVTKEVTVSQAGNPDVVDNISDINAVGTTYTVRGTVVATNSRGFVIGDGTGYVYYYKNAAVTQSIGDKVKISGTTGTYGHIIQFTNSATVSEATSSSYTAGTPAATVITAVPDYSEGYHLSTYLEFEGTLSKDGNNYLITLGDSQIQISYPTEAQGTALTALVGKTAHVKGYFSGINSNSKFTIMLESIEEVVVTPYTLTVVAEDGSVEISGMALDGGQCEIGAGVSVTATATPNEHHRFTSWTADGITLTDATANPLTFTMPNNNVTLTANFEENSRHCATFYILGEWIDAPVYYEGEDIEFPNVTAPIGYTFMGWTTIEFYSGDLAPADLVTSAVMGTSDVSFYAVFAVVSDTPATLTKMASGDTFEDGDKVVIVAYDNITDSDNPKYYAIYQETVSTSWVGKYEFDGNASTVAADDKNWLTVTADNGNWKLGDATNGYLYSTSSNNLSTNTGSSSSFTLAYSEGKGFTLKYGSRWLSLRTDTENNTFRLGGTGSSPLGVGYFDIYKYVAGSTTYSHYCTIITSVPVTVSQYKYASFSSDYALDFTDVDDVVAYIVTDANGSAIITQQVTKVKAGTGLVLYSETADDYYIPIATGEVEDYSETNKLIAVTEDNTVINKATDGTTNYVLTVKNDKAVFAYINSTPATLNKGQAYLNLEGEESAPYLGFGDEGTTGIVNVNRETITNNQYYTLDGRRVENPSNGVYIVNGKKVVIK